MKKIFLTSLCISVIALSSCTTIPNTAIINKANSWEGRYYRHGVSAQCASWVGSVVKSAGITPPSGYAKSTRWLSWGQKVSVANIQPGDVVVYARGKSGYHHAAIYQGNGRVIHRSTRKAPVKTMNLHYRRILGVRRGKRG